MVFFAAEMSNSQKPGISDSHRCYLELVIRQFQLFPFSLTEVPMLYKLAQSWLDELPCENQQWSGLGHWEFSEYTSVKEMTHCIACKCQVQVSSSVPFI